MRKAVIAVVAFVFVAGVALALSVGHSSAPPPTRVISVSTTSISGTGPMTVMCRFRKPPPPSVLTSPEAIAKACAQYGVRP